MVRSIQIQDKDVKDAHAGSRVGLAVKNSSIDELSRGRLLCASTAAFIDQELTLPFKKNPYYMNPSPGRFHMTVGLQTIPVHITDITEHSISFTTDNPFCYTKDDVFLFLNLNAEKLHFIGSATQSIC
jgi:selenocysteine-specific translation elongation factor